MECGGRQKHRQRSRHDDARGPRGGYHLRTTRPYPPRSSFRFRRRPRCNDLSLHRRDRRPATFGLDIVFEPIWSHTWAEMDPLGPLLEPCGLSRDRQSFPVRNATVRMGAGRQVGRAAFQLGVQMRSIWYRLEQQDNLLNSYRQQTENWLEWTPTWGASVKFPEFEVRYQGRITTGTGRPGLAWSPLTMQRLTAAEAANFIIAPGGPLTLQQATVMTHQISIALPIR